MGFDAGECPARVALAAWRIMGGLIDWQALPILAALYGVEDVELFVVELIAIRDHIQRQQGAK